MLVVFWLLGLVGAIACGVLFFRHARSIYERLADETLHTGRPPIN